MVQLWTQTVLHTRYGRHLVQEVLQFLKFGEDGGNQLEVQSGGHDGWRGGRGGQGR